MIQPLDPRSKRQYADLQGLGRALAVSSSGRPPDAGEGARRSARVKWTTAYRTLVYLCDNGFLHRDAADRRVLVGSRLFSIGSAVRRRSPARSGGAPYLKAAVDETGHRRPARAA